MEFKNHSEICSAVGNMTVDYGVVAIENVIDGVVAETIRAIESVDSHLGLKIQGEVVLPIELFYMNASGEENDVKKLFSHPVAIGQCRKLVSELQSKGIPIEVQPSTAHGAEQASNNPKIAALATLVALDNFELKLIRTDPVTDYKNSATRFWILSKEHAKLDNDLELKFKTCFLANLEQSVPGVLHKTLGVFAEKEISVLLVYPNPVLGKRWEYTFVIEVSGHVSDENMIEAWEDFRKLGISLWKVPQI